ncbi:hypothetical protein OAN61_00455 [bacterium]|nr:hypothetical protein [bacterium]
MTRSRRRELGLAILATCAPAHQPEGDMAYFGNGSESLRLKASSASQAILLALSQPLGSLLHVHTAAGSLRVGVALGTATVEHAMVPRSLMLVGAELLVHTVSVVGAASDTANPIADGASGSSLHGLWRRNDTGLGHRERVAPLAFSSIQRQSVDDDLLLTRGFENAAAVARVGPHGSALANWCNDMLPQGCSTGQALLPLRMHVGEGKLMYGSFNLSALRAQRKVAIWGDAFRRPFQCVDTTLQARTPTDKVTR